MESSTFVLHCTSVMTSVGISAHSTEGTFFGQSGGGHSAVYGPVGHYSRPELLWLGVDAREKKHVRAEGESVEGEVKKFDGLSLGRAQRGEDCKVNGTATPQGAY